jgi:hypothetical protein
VSRPWELPATAWLDNRWNQALDLASAAPVPVSGPELAAAWERYGPDQLLGMLRVLAAVDQADSGAA